jgi:hypothetical protein
VNLLIGFLFSYFQAEEKMRVVHDRKCRRLKRLDEKGAEAHKVDTTRTLIRSLSTKIKIAIQVVDKISVTINKIRDEELWPQLSELIQGYVSHPRSVSKLLLFFLNFYRLCECSSNLRKGKCLLRFGLCD